MNQSGAFGAEFALLKAGSKRRPRRAATVVDSPVSGGAPISR
ncbi:hypothetical protein WQQ_36420 [Hydrocarboniphaga effusa AP103]|uniref:Uncharacterized protein n=1 Tax=Hydrocarboniphaga effusa AP103 TaxID=1172194 RepID=I7Z9X8_9GAMM|nr:hypothetical protein WQQ_36420 [Hydrocarboniphaga effusa AP103]